MPTLSLNDRPWQPLGGRSYCLPALGEDRLERPVGAGGEHQRALQTHTGVEEPSVAKGDQRRHRLIIERRQRIIRNRQTLTPHAASSRYLGDSSTASSLHNQPVEISCRPTQPIHASLDRWFTTRLDQTVNVVLFGGADFDSHRHSEPPTAPGTSG
jgi:hypothetical protein